MTHLGIHTTSAALSARCLHAVCNAVCTCRQRYLHNKSPQNRSTARTELMARALSEVGITHARHVVNGKRMLTAKQLARKCDAITEHDAQAILDGVQARAKAALQQAAKPTMRAGEYWTAPDGCVHQVTAVERGVATVERHRLRPDTRELIRRTCEATRRVEVSQAGWERACVRARPTRAAADEHRRRGGTAELRHEQRTALPPVLVAPTMSAGAAPPDEVGITQPPTLTAAPPQRLSAVTRRSMTALRVRQRFVMPRAWDPLAGGDHYARLYSDYTHAQRVERMSQLAANAGHDAIPRAAQDTLLEVYLSAVRAARPKYKPTAGAEATSVEALMHDALGAKYAFRYLFERWQGLTGEQLSCENVRHTLLGDRLPHPRERDAQPTLHQEVFGLLHACVLHAIKVHAATHGAPESLGAAHKLVHDARMMAQTAVEARWRRLRQDGRGGEFMRTWVEMGFADANGGGNNVPVLTALNKHIEPPSGPASTCTVDMYTDGGGSTHQCRHSAGWGCAVVQSVHGHKTTHLHLGQLRVDEHRAVEERGVTNNDAELRGLLEAASA